jgi:hypothetical protein
MNKEVDLCSKSLLGSQTEAMTFMLMKIYGCLIQFETRNESMA